MAKRENGLFVCPVEEHVPGILGAMSSTAERSNQISNRVEDILAEAKELRNFLSPVATVIQDMRKSLVRAIMILVVVNSLGFVLVLLRGSGLDFKASTDGFEAHQHDKK
jgi:hypothetical protein